MCIGMNNAEITPSKLLQRVNDLKRVGFNVSIKVSKEGVLSLKIEKKKSETERPRNREMSFF